MILKHGLTKINDGIFLKCIYDNSIIKLTKLEGLMKVQLISRNDAFKKLNITRMQYVNCLLPLWQKGQGTVQEIAEYIKKPINEVVGRFTECYDKMLIIPHPVYPFKTKHYSTKYTKQTNYILTNKGEEIINKIGGNYER